MKIVTLIISHSLAIILGFAIGIYALPILTAPDAPDDAELKAKSANAVYKAWFKRDLQDSDAFHWGEGEISIGKDFITHVGELAPGPDYMLYLSPEFIETEARFKELKSKMALIGEVKTFNNFTLPVSETVDITQYNTAIVWCESFGEFISAAQYQ